VVTIENLPKKSRSYSKVATCSRWVREDRH